AHGHTHLERLAATDRGRVVHADPAMNLVVKTDLAVQFVLVPSHLHAVHPQIRLPPAGVVGIFRVYDRKRDKRPAVVGPIHNLRKSRDGRFVGEDRRAAGEPRNCVEGRTRCTEVLPWTAKRFPRIDLQSDQLSNGVESVAEQKSRSFGCSEQVTDDRERAALEICEESGRASRPIESALDLGRLKKRIDFVRHPDQVPVTFQVIDTLAKSSVSHEGRWSPAKSDWGKENVI